MLLGLGLSLSLWAPLRAQTSIPAGVPLRIAVDQTIRQRPGASLTGHLIAPVYLADHVVLPAGTVVTGHISSTRPVDRHTRVQALLNADFTPLAKPAVTFDSITLPGSGPVSLDCVATQRDATVVRMGGKRQSRKQQALAQARQRAAEALETVRGPHKMDRARRFVFYQLPGHPQYLWAGTQFDADLVAPLAITTPQPAPLPREDLRGVPVGVIEARLTTSLDSAVTRKGDPARAVVTVPLLSEDKASVLMPEGTVLLGSVLQVRPARWFARNGQLRFTFRQIVLPGAPARTAHGELAAAEGAKGQNVAIDQEGGARATGGKDKLLAPLALGLIAASGAHHDHSGAASGVVAGGFGLITRAVVAATRSQSVAVGFGAWAFGKSLYYRWIARGRELTFPADTRMVIQLNQR